MSLTDGLAAWLDSAREGRARLDELQLLEDAIRLSYASLGPSKPGLEGFLRDVCAQSLLHYLEAIEFAYELLETRDLQCLEAAEWNLREGYCAMQRCDALLEHARETLHRPVERGVA